VNGPWRPENRPDVSGNPFKPWVVSWGDGKHFVGTFHDGDGVGGWSFVFPGWKTEAGAQEKADEYNAEGVTP